MSVLLALLGCTGSDGPSGPKGLPGLTGPNGDDGSDGDDGQSGDDGADGADGGAMTLESDTLWTGKRVLDGVVYVPAGITLTVKSGSTVGLLPDAGIVVDGVLLAGGAHFEAASTVTSGTLGVLVGGTEDASDLDGASFTDVDLRLEGLATPGVADAVFDRAQMTVISRPEPFEARRLGFFGQQRDGGTSLWLRNADEVEVHDSAFDTFTTGIHFASLTEHAHLVVRNTTFTNGNQAINTGNLGWARHHVELQDLSIRRMIGYGILAYRTDLVVQNALIDDVFQNGILLDKLSTGVIRDTTVKNTLASAIVTSGDGFTAQNVVVREVRGIGIQADNEVILDNVDVSGTTSHCIEALSQVDAGLLTLSDCGADGIQLTGDAVVQDAIIAEVAGHCMDVNGDDVTVLRADLQDCGTDGVEANGGTFTDLTVRDVGDDCVDINSQDSTLTRVDLAHCGGHGVEGSAFVRFLDSSVHDTGSNGVLGVGIEISNAVLTDVGARAVQAGVGPLTADRVRVEDPATDGFYTTGQALITDVTVLRAGSYGVYANLLDLQICTLTDSGLDGVYAYGIEPSFVKQCTISGSERWGVRQVNTGSISALDVLDSNIVGNLDWGIYDARRVAGCYVADNRGEVGADLATHGVLDGVRDSTTAQIDDADVIETPSATLLSLPVPTTP